VAIEKKKNRKSKLGLWVLAGVVVIAGSIIGWRIWQNRQNMSAVLANIETEPYQRQTLYANVYGTGTIEPAQSAYMTWSTSGMWVTFLFLWVNTWRKTNG